jgi:hypothetical protein
MKNVFFTLSCEIFLVELIKQNMITIYTNEVMRALSATSFQKKMN